MCGPRTCASAGGDLRQVGDDEDLVVAAQTGQRPAHGHGGLPADAGVDLVEDEGGGRLGEHEAQGEHGAGQLAARGDLGQRQRRRARVGGQEDLDVVARVLAPHLDLDPRPGHGQLGQVLLDAGGQLRSGGPAGGGHLGGRRGLLGPGLRQLGVELGGPLVVALQLGQSGPQALALGDDVGQRLAVLATQLAQQVPALPDRLQALGVVLDGLADAADLPAMSATSAATARSRSHRGERSPADLASATPASPAGAASSSAGAVTAER